jgi:hypothetical protein
MVEENTTNSSTSLENWERIKSWVGFWVEGVLIPILCVFGILGKIYSCIAVNALSQKPLNNIQVGFYMQKLCPQIGGNCS